MKNDNLKNKIKNALRGIIVSFKEETNFKIHYLSMILVVIASIYFKISTLNFVILLIMCTLVIGLELVNTALENIVDLYTKEKNEFAKKAKDAAAGAVLFVSIMSFLIALLVFVPYSLK